LNALQGITRDPGLFSKAVAISPVFNWVSTKRYVTDTGRPSYMFDMLANYPQNLFRTLQTGPLGNVAGSPDFDSNVLRRQNIAWLSSPASQLENYDEKYPLLMIQGDADEEVPFEETIAVVRALRSLGIDANTLVFPDETHCINAYRNQLLMWKATADLLRSK